MAATAERDRVVEEVMRCTVGPALIAAAEKVANGATMVVELKREIAESAAPVEIGEREVAGNKKRKSVQVV